ncbi:PucR family transcriptional regulator [Amycolatopsis sp. FU40]|uniref:PucR family transcriptional regulator n=1 Tax=Amycolatopsis sp. FU40 TaxID=2914159 RepID=UPI001F18EEA4|nr:PucR family transcriptional regulator [Amycolatopsis sp. FU40]UKD51814.1 PucR family transcriptional regulator [Amycolatopsis sp. FU40]
MHLTLRDVLELPVMAAGAPVVRSAADAVDVPVRSVHVSELSDVAGTLTSDVLVLSIGRAFTEPGFDAVAYVRSLRDAGAIGLVVEPGQHLKSLPDALVQAARAARFPLVELRSTVRFIEVTEIVHARIVNAHYERLRLAERAHEAFSTVGSASQAPDAVLAHAADLIGLPVVLEDRTHRALAFAGVGSAESLLRDWPARSRRVPFSAATEVGGPEGWMCTPVGPPRERWGRLVVPARSAEQPAAWMVLERAAEALTVGKLLERSPLSVEIEAQGDLLRDLLHGADEGSVRARARALGLAAAAYYAVLVCRPVKAGQERALLDAVLTSDGIGGVLAEGRVAAVFPCSSAAAEKALLERVVAGVPAGLAAAFGAAGPVRRLGELPAALQEAVHVADVESPGAPGLRRAGDLGVRGLLWWLREHPRLHEFTEAQLRPLLTLPEPRASRAFATLRAFVESGYSMTEFAKALNLSRPAAYSRLATIERLLGVDLSDPDTRLSLHLAVLAHGHRDSASGAPAQ